MVDSNGMGVRKDFSTASRKISKIIWVGSIWARTMECDRVEACVLEF